LRAAVLRLETRARLGHDRGAGRRRLDEIFSGYENYVRHLRIYENFWRHAETLPLGCAARLESFAPAARGDGRKRAAIELIRRSARRSRCSGAARGLRRDVQAARVVEQMRERLNGLSSLQVVESVPGTRSSRSGRHSDFLARMTYLEIEAALAGAAADAR
jgi:hypothetical protein